MSLAHDLVDAVQKALARRAELIQEQVRQLENQREALSRLVDSGTSPDELRKRCDVLQQELVSMEVDDRDLDERLPRVRGEVQSSLALLRERLVLLCRKDREQQETEALQRSFVSAIQAFSAELAKLNVPFRTSSTAQQEAQLPKLAKHAQRMRDAAREMAVELSAKVAEQAEQPARLQKLDEERESWIRLEMDVDAALRAHAPAGIDLPPLAQSIAEADEKVLTSLQRDVLDPLLRDLRTERGHRLAPGFDPLRELRSEMTIVR